MIIVDKALQEREDKGQPIRVAIMFLAAGSWIQCRWIPGRPRLTSEVKSMLRFGLNVTGFTMFDFAGKSADRVAIGYRTGAASLGYYQNAAFVYDNLIDIIVGPLHGGRADVERRQPAGRRADDGRIEQLHD